MTPTIEDRLRQTLHAVAAATPISPVPVVPAVARHNQAARARWRRPAAALGILAGLSVAGLSAAAAGGAFSHGASAAFDGWEHVNPATATQLASIPGPAGERIESYIAPESGNNYTCIAFRIVGNPQLGDGAIGGSCAPDLSSARFAGSGSTAMPPPTTSLPPLWIFTEAAGSATSASIEYAGHPHRLVVKAGWMTGWVPAKYSTHVVITARDANGHTIGQLVGGIGDHPAVITTN